MKSKVLILTAVLASSAMGATATLTMDEVPNQVIDGLVISKGGINFSFSNPALTMRYNNPAAVGLTFVTGQSIVGVNSPFGVTFSVPVSNIQFGVSVDVQIPVPSMATVALFNNSAVPFTTVTLGSAVIDPFAEAQFTYNGSLGPVTNILVTPTGGGLTHILAFDNLTVTTAAPLPSQTSATGAPAASPLSLALTAICLAGVAWLFLRKSAA